jgi:hypothetical protein
MVRMEDVHLTLAGAAGSVNIRCGVDLEIRAVDAPPQRVAAMAAPAVSY